MQARGDGEDARDDGSAPLPRLSAKVGIQPFAMGEKSDYQRLASGEDEEAEGPAAPSCGFSGALPQVPRPSDLAVPVQQPELSS
ncbi:UNVERIFIED_CONTAM: hypothetical protein K2H54_064308 [Gekko kuhli]